MPNMPAVNAKAKYYAKATKSTKSAARKAAANAVAKAKAAKRTTREEIYELVDPIANDLVGAKFWEFTPEQHAADAIASLVVKVANANPRLTGKAVREALAELATLAVRIHDSITE